MKQLAMLLALFVTGTPILASAEAVSVELTNAIMTKADNESPSRFRVTCSDPALIDLITKTDEAISSEVRNLKSFLASQPGKTVGWGPGRQTYQELSERVLLDHRYFIDNGVIGVEFFTLTKNGAINPSIFRDAQLDSSKFKGVVYLTGTCGVSEIGRTP